MFELQILFANIIVPALVFTGLLILVRRFATRTGPAFESAVLVLGGAVVIQLAYGLRNGWSIWPEDAWQRIPTVTLLIAAVAAITEFFLPTKANIPPIDASPELNASTESPSTASKASLLTVREIGVWSVRAGAILWAALAIFPSGESWAELQAARTWWLAVITLSVAGAWFAAGRIAHAVTPAFGFALIPWTIAAAVLISQSFMKVTEPMLAIATVLGLSSVFDWLRWRTLLQSRLPSSAVVAVLGPLHFASAAAVAHGQFYSFLELPQILYTVALFVPAIVASAVLASAAFASNGQAARSPTIVAIVISIALSAFVLYRTLR